MGEDLLPSRTLSTTSTICELKYGEKPMVGVHYKPNGTKTPEPAFHELNDGSKTYKEQIEKFVYVKEDREKTPYEKIELFFPHPLFKVLTKLIDEAKKLRPNFGIKKFRINSKPLHVALWNKLWI